jgi:predicted transport protein
MSKLLIDGIRFKLWIPEPEESVFQPIIRKHSKEIFGKNTRFINASARLKSEAGIGSEPDGFVINLIEKKLYLIEVELSKHHPYNHISNQLIRFVNGMDSLSTKSAVTDALFEEIEANKKLKRFFEEHIEENLYKWLKRLVNKPPTIVVIIEEKTKEVVEACKILMKSYNTQIIEFKSFQREDAPTVHAHLFDSIKGHQEIIMKQDKKEKKTSHQTWENMYNWIDQNTKELVNEFQTKICSLGRVIHKPSGTDYIFYKGKRTSKSTFAALLLRKSSIRIRIRVDPTTIRDGKGWIYEKVYRGWFFKRGKGEERAFDVKEKSQIPYAMELIKQSYNLAE